jgi:hypothetical protein
MVVNCIVFSIVQSTEIWSTLFRQGLRILDFLVYPFLVGNSRRSQKCKVCSRRYWSCWFAAQQRSVHGATGSPYARVSVCVHFILRIQFSVHSFNRASLKTLTLRWLLTSIRHQQIIWMCTILHKLIFLHRCETIFYFSLLLQLSTLIARGYIAQTSAAVNLSEPKFRCLVDLNEIRAVGNTLGFNVNNYLIDFTPR